MSQPDRSSCPSCGSKAFGWSLWSKVWMCDTCGVKVYESDEDMRSAPLHYEGEKAEAIRRKVASRTPLKGFVPDLADEVEEDAPVLRVDHERPKLRRARVVPKSREQKS